MTDKADNDALVTRLERLLPQMADPDWLRGEELPATASLVSMLPAILAALRTPQPDETETLRAALKLCLNFIENTESELGVELECGIKARQALKGTDHGRG